MKMKSIVWRKQNLVLAFQLSELPLILVHADDATPVVLSVGPTVFRGKNLTNSAANLVNSAAYRGKADEIPRLTAETQLNFRSLINSRINRSNTCYELMNPSLFIH